MSNSLIPLPQQQGLTRYEKSLGRIVALHTLAIKELRITLQWAAYLGTYQLNILEHQARAAELEGRMPPEGREECCRRIENHQAKLTEMVDQAYLAIVDILAS